MGNQEFNDGLHENNDNIRTNEDIRHCPLTGLLQEVFLYSSTVVSLIKSMQKSESAYVSRHNSDVLVDHSWHISEILFEKGLGATTI